MPSLFFRPWSRRRLSTQEGKLGFDFFIHTQFKEGIILPVHGRTEALEANVASLERLKMQQVGVPPPVGTVFDSRCRMPSLAVHGNFYRIILWVGLPLAYCDASYLMRCA